jgi:hypothetical protein
MELTDYLADWAIELRTVAAEQRDSKTKKKLLALAEEAGRITLLAVLPAHEKVHLN